jgi:hypothetical protein
MSHRGDRRGGAEFGAEPTILGTEITLAPEEGRRGSSPRSGERWPPD